MNLALHICFLLACAACYAVQTVYFTHMLQLNSYRPERYGKWCRENPGRLFFIGRLLPVAAAALLFVPPERIGYGAAMIVLGGTAVLGYLPVLLAVSLLTGTLTGFVAGLLFRAMKNVKLSR